MAEIRYDPSVLSPEYFELLLCQDVVAIFNNLTTRNAQESLNESIFLKDKDDSKGVFYRKHYPLSFGLCLVPILLFKDHSVVGPVLQVSAESMDDAFYVLAKADDPNIVDLNGNVLMAAYKHFNPDIIPKEKIFKLTPEVVKKFPLNPIFVGDQGNIYCLKNIPQLLKHMAVELKIANLLPSRSSLLPKMRKTDINIPLAPKMSIAPQFLNIFNTSEYKKENEIVSKFLHRLVESYSKCRGERYFISFFSPLLHILQSSGYGKSRLAIQLGTNIPVLYSSLLKKQGYPFKSIYMSLLVERFRQKFGEMTTFTADEGCALVFTLILRFLYIILNSPHAQNIKKDVEKKALIIDECINSYFGATTHFNELEIFKTISDGIMNLEPDVSFNANHNLYPIALPQSCQEFIWKVNGRCILSTTSIETDVSLQIEDWRKDYQVDDSSKHPLPMIFVIDEADGLLYSKEKAPLSWQFLDETVVAFNVYRRMFRNFSFFWKYLWPVFISSNGKINNLHPEIYKDLSRKPGKPAQVSKVVPPFELVETFGIHLDRNEAFSRTNWIDYLKSSQRCLDMYKCGRPLIYDTFMIYCKADADTFLDMKYSNCEEIIFFSAKIFGTSNLQNAGIIRDLDIHQKFAILGLSVAFDDFPRDVDRDVLISSHMMTMLNYNSISETLNGIYPPEGILNAVASWHLCVNLDLYLKVILAENSLVDSGTLGELICKISLLHARICLPSLVENTPNEATTDDENAYPELTFPVRRQLMGYVKIEEYLTSLTGDSDLTEKYLRANEKLRGSCLSFSYFHSWQDEILDLDGLLGECIVRGCAIQLKTNHRAIDLMIPLVLANGSLSFIAIQVKLWTDRLHPGTPAKIKQLHREMSFANIFANVPLPKARPYACILQNVFSLSGELSCQIVDGSNTAEIMPPCIFICGAYSASMDSEYIGSLKKYCKKIIPIVTVMKGLRTEDFYRKEEILRCYYGQQIMTKINSKYVSTIHRSQSLEELSKDVSMDFSDVKEKDSESSSNDSDSSSNDEGSSSKIKKLKT